MGVLEVLNPFQYISAISGRWEGVIIKGSVKTVNMPELRAPEFANSEDPDEVADSKLHCFSTPDKKG